MSNRSTVLMCNHTTPVLASGIILEMLFSTDYIEVMRGTQPPGSLVKVSYFTVQPTQVQTASASATCFGPILSQNGATFSSRAPERPRFSNQKGRKKGKNVKIFVPHSFESILAGRSSFKWLYDSATLEKFLEEARGLKTKSAAETDEMRNVLLDRHLDASNICKYPNSVIRVFVRLLRNEEAPASMSKNELAHLCVNWKCKKRHYWCLLEDGRMNCPRKFTKVHDVRSADGPSQSRGSLNQTVQMCFKRKYSDSHDAVDFKGTGHANQPGAASFRRSQESPVQIFQSQESAISSPGRDLDIATVRRDDAEGPSFEELARPSNLKLGNRVTCTLDRESALEASGGKNSRGEDPSGSEEASLRLGDRTIDHGNHATTVFQDVKDRTQPMSKHFPQYDPTSWDRASSSKAIDGVPVRVELVASEEPAPSADHRGVGPAVTDVNMQTEPDKLVPQNYKKSFLPSRPAPELYGENIIVITGFKSCASKGSASVCHGDEAAQLDGGSFAMGNSRFASASRLPSTSYDGCKPSETHFGASRADTTQRKGYCESGSRDGDLTRSFLDNINSEATELAPRRDEHVRSQEYDSNFSDSGVTKTCPEPQSKGHSVHGDFHTEEMRKSGSLASVLDHDRGNMFHGDRSKSLVSVEDITVRMAIDPRSTTSPGNADRAAFSSTDCAAQLLTAEVRHESLLSRDEDHVSQTVTNTRHMAHVSELVTDEDEGTRKELFDNGSWQENLSLILPTQAVGPRDTFACWCKICSRDFSFCRGCMCSFCQEILQPGEDWKVVKCICGHVCHMDCALAANAAGVVKELGLDGELSCPSCSRKVDLWLFFQKKIDMISSLGQVANANLKDLERLLLHSLELLKGTEKIKYKSIEELVRESYELIRNFPILDLVQSLLRAVRDELKMSHSGTVLSFHSVVLSVVSSLLILRMIDVGFYVYTNDDRVEFGRPSMNH